MDSIKPWILAIILLAILVEVLWARSRRKRIYDVKESLANVGILLGNNLLKPLALGWSYLVFRLFESFRFFELPANVGVAVLTFLTVEFVYYWYHRLSHEIPLLWTIHHAHHSSPKMNLTTAMRLNWLGKFVSPLFFVPLVVLGFSAEWMVVSLALGLFYQFFLHTELVGKLGWFEGKLLNTPSSHRVHHGSNERYIDKNYGGVLILWDRLFGTWAAETEPVKYGVTTGSVGHNPVKIVLGPLLQYLRGNWKREKAIVAERQSTN